MRKDRMEWEGKEDSAMKLVPRPEGDPRLEASSKLDQSVTTDCGGRETLPSCLVRSGCLLGSDETKAVIVSL